MVVRTPRRLPGFNFEYQPPPPTDVLPRMDVAAFICFAASGPLHIPVAVDDITQFTMIFGEDIPLAWDKDRSEEVYAYLAPTVRAFFRNGGLRCWVIRVAGDEAQYNYFPVPGLALVNDDRTLTPAFVRARSEGSWSDELRVGASLISSAVSASQLLVSPSEGILTVNLALTSPRDISIGDLVRLTFNDGEYVLMLLVDSVQLVDATTASSPPDGPAHLSMVQVTASASTAFWFKAGPLRSPLPSPMQAVVFAHDAPMTPITVSNYRENDAEYPPITLSLSASLAKAPNPGTLIRVDCDTEQLWLTVQQVDIEQDSGSPPGDMVVVKGQGLWLLQEQNVPQPWPTAISQAEKLSFTLWVRQGNDFPQVLSDLTFGQDHPSFWKALPSDEQLYRGTEVTSNPTHSVLEKTLSYSSYTDLWQRALNPRFPLAGNDAPGVYYLPIAMPVSPDYYLGLDKGSSEPFAAPRTRDGLGEFSTNLFLDMDMAEALTPDLIMQANYLRYESVQPRLLKGIYAALDIEEATLIAIPDAYQLGWIPAFVGSPPQAQGSNPLPHPEWWHCQADVTANGGPGTQSGTAGNDAPTILQGAFHNCDRQVIAPPPLELLDGPDVFGTFTLDWKEKSAGPMTYILEEALRPDWVCAVVIYDGQ